MPIVSFSTDRQRYKVLEGLAKREGVSISKIVKKIVESYIDVLIINQALIMPDYILAINNAALINADYISAINNRNIDAGINNQALLIRNIDSSKAGNSEEKPSQLERGSDPISADELVQRIADLLEKRLSRKIQDQLNPFTTESLAFQGGDG